MQESSYVQAALFEHRFWLQIMGDHARFIANALSPREMEEVSRAYYFIQAFDSLLEESRKPLASELLFLNQEAYRLTMELREFKLHLLKRHLIGNISISLPPTFLNHMLNELEEYLRILACLTAGESPPLFNPVHYHLLWLLDATGHASTIAANLDMVEKVLISKSMGFEKQFQFFYLKAVELAGYMRTRLQHFPALSRFNKDVELEMLLFVGFLQELEEMRLDLRVLGTLAPLVADHMAREECYYLTKLSLVSEVNQPDCDPTKPRFET